MAKCLGVECPYVQQFMNGGTDHIGRITMMNCAEQGGSQPSSIPGVVLIMNEEDNTYRTGVRFKCPFLSEEQVRPTSEPKPVDLPTEGGEQ
jgi:hypothetical protein